MAFHPPYSPENKVLSALRDIIAASDATTVEDLKRDLLAGLKQELPSPKDFLEVQRAEWRNAGQG